MRARLSIKRKDGWYCVFCLDFYDDIEVIDVEDVCYMVAKKVHDHLYELKYFIYKNKNLGMRSFRGKKELLAAIKLLVE